MKQSREDLFNAMLVDVVADQVRRALELGWRPKEVEEGVLRGMGHGLAEYRQGLQFTKGGTSK
jgi:hypothetical protein